MRRSVQVWLLFLPTFWLVLGCAPNQPAQTHAPRALSESVPSTATSAGSPASTAATLHSGRDGAPTSNPPPCPAPTEQQKKRFGEAYHLANTTPAAEPERALAEVIRVRLGQLFQSGCGARRDSKELVQQIALLNEAPPREDELPFSEQLSVDLLDDHVLVAYGTENGDAVAVFAWRDEQMETQINLTRRGPGVRDRLVVESSRLFHPKGVEEPLLVVQMADFWYTSCWGQQRFRVYRASVDPHAPESLFARDLGARRCEFDAIEIRDNQIRFGYAGGTQVFYDTGIPRGYNLELEYVSGKLIQRFAASSVPQDLVADWLWAPWSSAREGTAVAAATTLQREHARLARAVRAGLQEHSATKPFRSKSLPGNGDDQTRVRVTCADPYALPTKPCRAWPKPVDFHLRKHRGAWLVEAVEATE
ncbi:MAG: hypothetical protein R3B89_32375 [Polyangiaceae bacterium]